MDEVLKLLQVMTGDRRYEEIFRKKKEGVHSMCDVAERLEQMGIAKGIEIGRSEGRTEEKIEGKIEGKILVYRNLCREGFDEKEARRLTELPEDVMPEDVRLTRITYASIINTNKINTSNLIRYSMPFGRKIHKSKACTKRLKNYVMASFGLIRLYERKSRYSSRYLRKM